MFTLNCRGRLLVIERPIVMGIINTTPDSFYAGSRHAMVDDALRTAERMLTDGATILDVGGQSTRPGSQPPGLQEELERVLAVIEAIGRHFPEAYISIDTYHSEVAKQAVFAGASIVNDISGGLFDADMRSTVAALQVPYASMHLRGDAATMHQPQVYENLMRELLDHFIRTIAECTATGIKDIIIDPGFGFSKHSRDNFKLVKHLDILRMLERPILLGVSRKSTIYKTLGISAEEALNGTTVLNTVGLLKGASILRVHDVKEAVEAVRLVAEMM